MVERIKNMLAEKGFTLASAERFLGFGNGTIKRWDTSIPSADKLFSLANMLDTTMEFLLTGEVSISSLQSLSKKEQKIIEMYSQLSENGQERVYNYLMGCFDTETTTSKNSPVEMAAYGKSLTIHETDMTDKEFADWVNKNKEKG